MTIALLPGFIIASVRYLCIINLSEILKLIILLRSLSTTLDRIPSSKCFKILEQDFLPMGPGASGPDLAKTQLDAAQSDFHTAHHTHL